MKVIIDGIEFIPTTEGNPSAEQIARGIMEEFFGDLKYDWRVEAENLRVHCSDGLEEHYPTVMDVVASILKRLAPCRNKQDRKD